MTADQIREQWDQNKLEHLQAEDLPFAIAGILVEIAAQMAEINYSRRDSYDEKLRQMRVENETERDHLRAQETEYWHDVNADHAPGKPVA
jgi:hypothetical protein